MSDSIEEREAAARHLEGLGQAVIPALEKAARGTDPERAGRAAAVLLRIEIRSLVTPRMRLTLPDIESRLKTPESWAPVFKHLAQEHWPGFVHRKELIPFARKALRLMSSDQADETLRVIKNRSLRELAPELLDFCRNGPHEGLVAASLTLASWGHTEAIVALQPRLGDSSSAVRVAATTALALLGTSESYTAVLGTVRSKDPRVREEVATIVGLHNRYELAGTIVHLLEDPDGAVRKATLESLCRLRARPYSKAIAPLLRYKDLDTRLEAARTLIALRAEEHLTEILPVLRETEEANPKVLEDLGEHHWGSAIPYLLERMRNPKSAAGSRASTIKALGQLRALETVPDLIALLPDARLGDAAYSALKEMAPREILKSLIPYLEHSDQGAAERSLALLEESAELSALPYAIKLLDHPQRDVQIRAEKLLKALKATQATSTLAARLKHKDPEVAAAAVDILSSLPGPEIDTLLRQTTGAGEALVRASALRALGLRNDVASRDLLKAGLTDSSPYVRRAAIEALSWLEAPELGPFLLRAVALNDGDFSEFAVSTLKHLKGSKAWLADLGLLLKHEDVTVRTSGLALLEAHEDRSFLPQLLPLLKDKDSNLQRRAAHLAAKWGAIEALPLLITLLDEERDADEVIAALGGLRGPVVAKALLGWMKTAPYTHQWRGVSLLGESRSPDAVDKLRDIFKHEDFGLRAMSLEALEKVAPFSVDELLQLAQEDPDSYVRTTATDLLSKRIPPVPLELLLPLAKGLERNWAEHYLTRIQRPATLTTAQAWVRALAHPELETHRALYIAVEVFGDPDVAPVVRPLLKDPRSDVRTIAAFALSRMRDVGAAADLIPLLEDPNPELRRAAARAVGAGKVRAAASGLIRLLKDPFEEVQWAAMHALGEIEDPSTLHVLVGMLSTRDRLLVDSAVRSLTRLEAKEAIPGLMALARTGHPYEASLAASALGWLGASEAIPLLNNLLKSGPRLRTEAAVGLALLGRQEGVPMLLEAGGTEPALNYLRAPETFKKLRQINVPAQHRSTHRAFLEYAAQEAGLSLTCFEPSNSSQTEWLTGPYHSPSWRSLLLEGDSTCSIVLNGNQLHVVDTDQASRMHRSWWESRSK